MTLISYPYPLYRDEHGCDSTTTSVIPRKAPKRSEVYCKQVWAPMPRFCKNTEFKQVILAGKASHGGQRTSGSELIVVRIASNRTFSDHVGTYPALMKKFLLSFGKMVGRTSAMASPLWVARLSMMTMSSGFKTGTKNCSTQASVVVFQCPWGTPTCSLSPLGQRRRGRVMAVEAEVSSRHQGFIQTIDMGCVHRKTWAVSIKRHGLCPSKDMGCVHRSLIRFKGRAVFYNVRTFLPGGMGRLFLYVMAWRSNKRQGMETGSVRKQKPSNDTHQSTTDEDARLYRKGDGQESKLAHLGHARPCPAMP